MNNINFRRAAAQDAQAVSDVYLLSFKTFITFVKPVHTDENVRQWIAEYLIPNTDVTVAEMDGQIVGLMALKKIEGIGWIDQLYLHPQVTGQGLGGQMVDLAKRTLGSPIRLYTFQPNSGARRFYEHHGFKAIEFGDGSGNEEKCPDVLYEWRE